MTDFAPAPAYTFTLDQSEGVNGNVRKLTITAPSTDDSLYHNFFVRTYLDGVDVVGT